MQDDPRLRTRTLARVLGPYLVLMAAVLLVRAGAMPLLLPAFMQDGPLVLTAGAFTALLGLAILAAHHHWSSPAAIAVTLIGWAALLKGAWLLLAPELGAPFTAMVVRTPPLLLLTAALILLLGAWLSFVGWLSNKDRT